MQCIGAPPSVFPFQAVALLGVAATTKNLQILGHRESPFVHGDNMVYIEVSTIGKYVSAMSANIAGRNFRLGKSPLPQLFFQCGIHFPDFIQRKVL